MKNLRLLPDIHRQQKIIKAAFARENDATSIAKRNLVRFFSSFEYSSKLDIQNPEPHFV